MFEKGSVLYTDAMRLAWESRKIVIFMMIVDIFAFFMIAAVIPRIDLLIYQSNMFSIITYILLMYIGAVPLIYSLFKFFVLDFTRSVVHKGHFTFKRFFGFYTLNLRAVVLPVIFALMLLLAVSVAVEQKYAGWLFAIIMLPLLLLYYPFLQIAHARFYSGAAPDISAAIRQVFSKSTLRMYSSSVIIVLAYILLSAILSPLLHYTLFSSDMMYTRFYPAFQSAYTAVTTALLLLIHSLNRIHIYRSII